jgi:type IV fimbrial biogenesis protein FimT
MKTCRRRAAQRGITWIEVSAVLAVLAVTTSAAVPSMSALIDGRRLEGSAVQFATDVQYARSEAVARNQAVRVSLLSTAAGTCYVLHTGAANACGCSADGPAVCAADAREIKTVLLAADQGVTVAANATSIVFDPMHGTSTPSATFRFVGRQGRAINQVINVMGRLRSCTPSGGVPGYPAC